MSIEAMNWALAQTAGSPGAKCILLILANRAHPMTGECYPGIDGIAEQSNMSARSVIRQIQKLEAVGLISVVHRGGTGEGRKSNIYKLHIEQSANLSQRAKCQPVTSNVTNLQGQSAILSPEPKDNPKKNPKSGAPPEFSELKRVYPKRAGSQPWDRCLKAIRARLKAGSTWSEILDGAKRYAAFIRANGKENTEYVMQAATFCGPDKHFETSFDLPTPPTDPAKAAVDKRRLAYLKKWGIPSDDLRQKH